MSNNLPALVDREGNTLRKGRISPALQSAIRLIVEEGVPVAEAAQRTGYKTESLAKAMVKPHVKAFRAGVKRAWLESKTAKAWVTVATLADHAGSEKVQLEAAKTILSAAGELAPEDGGSAGPGTLIQFIKNEFTGPQPLTQRLPGVVQGEDFQDADYEPLDSKPGLTGQDDT